MRNSIHQLINQKGGLTIKEKPATKTIDAHDARVHFGQLLNEVSEQDHTFFVKRRGKIAAVIISPEDYLDILEIGAELADSGTVQALAESKKQFKLGEVGSEEDIFKILRGE